MLYQDTKTTTRPVKVATNVGVKYASHTGAGGERNVSSALSTIANLVFLSLSLPPLLATTTLLVYTCLHRCTQGEGRERKMISLINHIARRNNYNVTRLALANSNTDTDTGTDTGSLYFFFPLLFLLRSPFFFYLSRSFLLISTPTHFH